MIEKLCNLQRANHERAISLVLMLVFGMQSVSGVMIQSSEASQWQADLENLSPDDPLAYYELAETVMDQAETDIEWKLARELLGYAGALNPGEYGASAAIALASLSQDEREARKFRQLALLMNPDQYLIDMTNNGQPSRPKQPSASAAMAIGRALSFYRRGQGTLALAQLESADAAQLLEQYDHALPGGVNRFYEDCRNYRGSLRPNLTDRDFMQLLRLEDALLSGEARRWSAEILLSDGAPLIEIDADNPEEAFQVDLSRPYWVNGRWTARPADVAVDQ